MGDFSKKKLPALNTSKFKVSGQCARTITYSLRPLLLGHETTRVFKSKGKVKIHTILDLRPRVESNNTVERVRRKDNFLRIVSWQRGTNYWVRFHSHWIDHEPSTRPKHVAISKPSMSNLIQRSRKSPSSLEHPPLCI